MRAYDVLFRRLRPLARFREFGVLDRALEPVEQVPVEALVEFLSVQRVEPRGQQTVEVRGLGRGASIQSRRLGRGQFVEYVQVGAMGVGDVYLPDEGYAAKHVALGVAFVLTAVDERERHQVGGGPEQDDGRPVIVEPIDDAGERRVLAARVAVVFQDGGYEHEAVGATAVRVAQNSPDRPEPARRFSAISSVVI